MNKMSSNKDETDNKANPKKNRKPLPEMPLDNWVEERTNKDCVKLYKSSTSLSPKYPQLRSDGFFLLMMTKPQIDLLKKLCDKLVVIDQHKGDKFEVITLNIIDDLGHSFPCASVFTDKIDQSVVKVFFTEIKSVIGAMNVKILMSGVDDFIYDIWSEVIGQPEKKAYCSSEVLKDWKKKLQLIQNKIKKSVVLNKLKTLLKECDKDIFMGNLTSLVSDLSIDIETAQFALYLVENYTQNTSSWAPCLVFNEDVKLNFQLESMHLTFKFVLQDKTTKRLDRALSNILELVRNKVYDRLLLISGDRSRTFNLCHKHNLSQKYTFKVIKNDSYWTVFTLSGKKEKHRIRFGDRECQCPQKCRFCEVCYHIYSCSCTDSNVRLNMCRHIHGMCMHQAAGTVIESAAGDSDESDEESEDIEQHQSLENYFTIEQEADVACQNLYVDDTLVQFDTVPVDGLGIIVDQYNQKEKVERAPVNVYRNEALRGMVQDTERSTPGSISFDSTKRTLENLFKSVLNNACNEHQLQEIEKTLYILQGKLQGVKSNRKSTKRPSKVQHPCNINQDFQQECRRNTSKKPRN